MFQQTYAGDSLATVKTDSQCEDRSTYFFCKRAMDLILSTLALIVLSPLMLLIAILIKLDSPGPIIFVQQRVGARRRFKDRGTVWEIRNFPMYKFRSMVRDADPSVHRAHVQALIHERENTHYGSKLPFKLSNDPRVTRVGRILRKTSLDELPQLINVIKGMMSLVGPRPVPPYEMAEYQGWQRERLAALPGITGLWQANGRGRASIDDMVRMDIEYIHRQSLWLDIKILLLTIPAVLSRHGAH